MGMNKMSDGAGDGIQEQIDKLIEWNTLLSLRIDIRGDELHDLRTQLAERTAHCNRLFDANINLAAKLVEAKKMADTLCLLDRDRVISETNEVVELRAQLAEQAHQVKLLNGIVTGMRYQVTVARNSVLLDVEQAVRAIHKECGDNCTIDAVRTAIRKIRKQGDEQE